MKPQGQQGQALAHSEESELLKLELLVAKRADKLWRRAGYCSGYDLMHWLQAETEVLGRYFGHGQPSEAAMVAGH